MFRLFETIVDPTAKGAPGTPPAGLVAFYWFFLGQVKGLFFALFVVGAVQAVADAAIPVFMGRIFTIVAETPRETLVAEAWPVFAGMLVLLLVVRPAIVFVQALIQHQAIAPGVTNLVRWQSHWHVIRQNLSFFQNDFAGRIGSRVMETGYAVRQTLVSATSVVWYLAALGIASAAVMARANGLLVLPAIAWMAAYVAFLVYIVPRLRAASKEISYARSGLVGRIVDSYTNIATVKLFSQPEVEDAYVREQVETHTGRMHDQMRWFTWMALGLNLLTGFLVGGTGAMAIWLWFEGRIGVDMVATVMPLTLQLTGASMRVAYEVGGIFEQIGTVHEGMETIAKPHGLVDRAGARPLKVERGEIRFEGVSFHYGRDTAVIDGLDLTIRPGEKIGLVGRSGAGKSTLVNLLLRFYDLESGRILIDGQDVADTTQASIRGAISVVTQDTSLLHRSILDNIRYGRPEATFDEVVTAAKLAHAHEFICALEDWRGRTGYDAHVGERGVKLSGGQRQRIAIARVILKNAPILVLDEATSALDSEVEAAIQESLEALMTGKTVIAIAHRLSTISRMDRLVVLDRGRIIEQGTHRELLEFHGQYARLWSRQSGGFLAEGIDEEASADGRESHREITAV